MLAKRTHYLDKQGEQIPKDKRFRANVADMFVSGESSASRVASLAADAHYAGARHVRDLADVEAKSSKKNLHRDLLRKINKFRKWPKPYYIQCRVWSIKKQAEIKVWLPILLPHELIQALATHCGSLEALLSKDGLSGITRRNFDMACAKLCLDPTSTLPCALWGDGVPVKFDRSQAVDIFTLSLPGLGGLHKSLRIPITCINSKYLLRHSSYDDILEAVAWSFKHLLVGCMPASRHDSLPWQKTDVIRRQTAGTKLLCKAILCEVRADWKFMKQCFRFPQHNQVLGCCWLCGITPKELRQVDSSASWRNKRLSHWDVLARLRSENKSISTIFGCPGLVTTCFLIDWLHCCDQGVSADFLGSRFVTLLPKMIGETREAKCSSLFKLILEYYKQHPDTPARLDNLSLSMIGFGTRAPKLKAQAGETRGLILFAHEACLQFLSKQDPIEEAVICASAELLACYQNLSSAVFSAEALAFHCKRFCALAVALEDKSPETWHIKPKLHLFQELCEYALSNPAESWCYRDEDAGGSLACISIRRGGSNSPHAAAIATLNKFCAGNSLPRIGL